MLPRFHVLGRLCAPDARPGEGDGVAWLSDILVALLQRAAELHLGALPSAAGGPTEVAAWRLCFDAFFDALARHVGTLQVGLVDAPEPVRLSVCLSA
jgi:hypothetical protein